MAKERNLGSTHLRLLSLRGSSRARPRCSPFSFTPAFGGSKKRTSRTTGLEPFPNLRKENIPPFTVCGGNDWGRCGRCVSTGELRLRSTCPCPGRPAFLREVAAVGGAVGGALSLASGVGMTRRFGTCRGVRLDDVRDEEDVDGDFATYWALIAAWVCDGGS
jgi:hypothetical protein